MERSGYCHRTDYTPMKLHPDLPIFKIDREDRSILYTPGYLAVVSPEAANRLQSYWVEGNASDCSHLWEIGRQLEKSARLAEDQWNRKIEERFQPECLTLYLSGRCNLSCRYCFSNRDALEPQYSESLQGPQTINEKAVEAAANLVARFCVQKDKPFHLVLHGGGEPTVHPSLIERITDMTKNIARKYGLDWFGYLATNGVMSESRAGWAAGLFSLIGLSCDGPAGYSRYTASDAERRRFIENSGTHGKGHFRIGWSVFNPYDNNTSDDSSAGRNCRLPSQAPWSRNNTN